MAEIFLSIIYLLFFLWLIGKMPLFEDRVLSLNWFRGLFLIKVVAAMALYWIYTRFYPDRPHADIFKYYDDSLIIYNTAFTKPYDFFRMLTGINAGSDELWNYYDAMRNWYNSEMIFNDSRTMIRINVLMRFVSFNTYFPHALMMTFLSFIGLTGLYNVFVKALQKKEYILMIGVYLLPSTLLWTSGMIKEAFLVFSIGSLIYVIDKCFYEKINFTKIVGIVFFSICLLYIKSYILIVIFPGILSWLVIKKIGLNKFLITLTIHFFYFLLLFNVANIYSDQSVPLRLINKQREFGNLVLTEKANSVIQLPSLENSTVSVILNSPKGFFNTLMRPTLLESKNPLLLAAGLENALILVCLILAIYFYFNKKNPMLSDLYFPALFFVVTMFVMIGLVTPIIGAIVRYKVPALPFLALLLITHINFRKINNSISKIAKR